MASKDRKCPSKKGDVSNNVVPLRSKRNKSIWDEPELAELVKMIDEGDINQRRLTDYLSGEKMEVYTLKKLSDKLDVGVRVLREYIKAGELQASKIGKQYVVTEKQLQVFLDSKLVIPSPND